MSCPRNSWLPHRNCLWATAVDHHADTVMPQVIRQNRQFARRRMTIKINFVLLIVLQSTSNQPHGDLKAPVVIHNLCRQHSKTFSQHSGIGSLRLGKIPYTQRKAYSHWLERHKLLNTQCGFQSGDAERDSTLIFRRYLEIFLIISVLF